jgi:hypothetical protein
LGKLVPFEKRNRTREGGALEKAGKAQILMFTGVRYERDTAETPPRPTATPRAKRKRG